jgi:hypothetical protein
MVHDQLPRFTELFEYSVLKQAHHWWLESSITQPIGAVSFAGYGDAENLVLFLMGGAEIDPAERRFVLAQNSQQ